MRRVASSRSTASRPTPSRPFRAANAIGGKHGVGICSHLVENRFVGIKSRGVYEAPGMEVIGNAYAYLPQLVPTAAERELLDQLSLFVSKQIYQGYGFDLGTHMARSAIALINALATGTIALKLYKATRSSSRYRCRTRCTRKRTRAWKRDRCRPADSEGRACFRWTRERSRPTHR
ncbi:MAG: argininosuccinate synthase [Gemmataceae bacterium]